MLYPAATVSAPMAATAGKNALPAMYPARSELVSSAFSWVMAFLNPSPSRLEIIGMLIAMGYRQFSV